MGVQSQRQQLACHGFWLCLHSEGQSLQLSNCWSWQTASSHKHETLTWVLVLNTMFPRKSHSFYLLKLYLSVICFKQESCVKAGTQSYVDGKLETSAVTFDCSILTQITSFKDGISLEIPPQGRLIEKGFWARGGTLQVILKVHIKKYFYVLVRVKFSTYK